MDQEKSSSTQIQRPPYHSALIPRRERSQIDCTGLFQTSQGTRALDLAAVGEKGRGTANCRSRQRLDDWAGTKKKILQPHRQQVWGIPPKANWALLARLEDGLAVCSSATH